MPDFIFVDDAIGLEVSGLATAWTKTVQHLKKNIWVDDRYHKYFVLFVRLPGLC